MKVLLVLLALASCGCQHTEHTYVLPGGEAIGCASDPVTDECGITLSRCGWDQNTTLPCLTNVRYVGLTEEQKP